MNEDKHPKVSLSELGNNQHKGLKCPECGCRHFQVIRTDQQAGYIQRRRVCRHCGKEIRTREITVD